MPRKSFRPSHRNPEEFQPEICQLTGLVVPAARLVVSDVQGLRGLAIGDTFDFERRARVRPGYEDLRGISPAIARADLIPIPSGERGAPYEEDPWLPTDLDDLLRWHDEVGIEAIGDGNTAATWTDRSGNDNDLTQSTASWRPTASQVGDDAVLDPIWELQFDGNNDYLSHQGFAAQSIPWTVGCVWRFLAEPYEFLTGIDEPVIHGTGDVAQSFSLSVPAGETDVLEVNHGSPAPVSVSVPLRASLSTMPHYSVASYSSAGTSLRLDGIPLLSGGAIGTATATALYIGLSNIAIRCLVVVNAVLSEVDTLLLESYLRYRARS